MPLMRGIVNLRQQCAQCQRSKVNSVPVSTLRYADIYYHCMRQTADCSTCFA
jgi:hypothetical protein